MAQDAQVMLSDEEAKRRKWRNIAIAVVLAALVVIFYIVTIVKLGGNVASKFAM
ncbi:MAG: hypothetical protein ACR2OR_06225 [Hyphomicrobiales bacterium]